MIVSGVGIHPPEKNPRKAVVPRLPKDTNDSPPGGKKAD